MAAGGSRFLRAGAQFQAQAIDALIGCQIEALDFLKHRFEQDRALTAELAGCVEFNDGMDVISTYARKAASDYAAEAGRMASLGSKLAAETAQRARREAQGALEDMAAQTAI